MREAIGSSWLFYLVITFLLIYVFFMSFIMNYASAYRAANYFVTQIETCQALNDDCGGNNYDNIMNSIREKYHYVKPRNRDVKVCCINNGKNSVYRVELPVAFDVPFLGTVNWIKVKAETKTIQNISCSESSWDNKC